MRAFSEHISEYLYIDQRRLDSYLQQIEAPVTYDKVPRWSASMKLTGPSASVSQDRVAREFTEHEKVRKLVEYLRTTRPPDFHAGRIEAQRVVVPAREGTIFPFSGVRAWITTDKSLFVIEDLVDADKDAYSVSGYSALLLLLNEMMTASPKRLGTDAEARFANDPLAFLLSIGGSILPTRTIDVVYRIRTFCCPGPDDGEEMSGQPFVVAYPIVIAG